MILPAWCLQVVVSFVVLQCNGILAAEPFPFSSCPSETPKNRDDFGYQNSSGTPPKSQQGPVFVQVSEQDKTWSKPYETRRRAMIPRSFQALSSFFWCEIDEKLQKCRQELGNNLDEICGGFEKSQWKVKWEI